MVVVAVVLVVIIVVMLLLLLLLWCLPLLVFYVFSWFDHMQWRRSFGMWLLASLFATCIPSRNFMGGARTWQLRACRRVHLLRRLHTHPLAVSCLPSQLCFLSTCAAPDGAVHGSFPALLLQSADTATGIGGSFQLLGMHV